MGHGGILLLHGLIKLVRRIAHVVAGGELGAVQSVRTHKAAGARNAGVEYVGWKASGSSRQKVEVAGFDILFDSCVGQVLVGNEQWMWILRRVVGAGLRHRIGGHVVKRFGNVRSGGIIGRLRRHRVLLSELVIRTGRAIRVHDALRQQIGDGLIFSLRLVNAEQVVEAAVFAEQDDDVLDRAPRGGIVSVLVGAAIGLLGVI